MKPKINIESMQKASKDEIEAALHFLAENSDDLATMVEAAAERLGNQQEIRTQAAIEALRKLDEQDNQNNQES